MTATRGKLDEKISRAKKKLLRREIWFRALLSAIKVRRKQNDSSKTQMKIKNWNVKNSLEVSSHSTEKREEYIRHNLRKNIII